MKHGYLNNFLHTIARAITYAFREIATEFLRNTPLTAFTIFIVSALVFTATQATTVIPDPDAFYHLKIAEFLAHGTLLRDFPYAAFTVLTQYYYDQHLLYHIFLIPFTFFPQPFVGLKIATILLGAGTITTFYALLKTFRVRAPAAFSLLLLISGPLIFRMSLPKAVSTSLIFLFVGLVLATTGKYVLLYLWSTLYVWAYGGFFILGVLVFLFILIQSLAHKKLSSQNIRVASALTLGFATGLIINPYFPNNIFYIWDQLVQIGILNYQDKIGVGGEWYPYKIGDILYDAWFITFLFAISLITFLKTRARQTTLSFTALVWAFFFLAFTLKSRRYIEYSIPFLVLSTALTFTRAYLTKNRHPEPRAVMVSLSNHCRGVEGSLKKHFLRFLNLPLTTILLIFLPLSYLFFFSIATSINTLTTTIKDAHDGTPYNNFAASMTWLREHGTPNTIVFHSDWDEFPALFYYNSNNYYIVGLDATFMYKYSPTLHKKWETITRGEEKNNLHDIIQKDFNAKYVFITKDHTSMYRNISTSPGFTQIYEDSEAFIFRVEEGM